MLKNNINTLTAPSCLYIQYIPLTVFILLVCLSVVTYSAFFYWIYVIHLPIFVMLASLVMGQYLILVDVGTISQYLTTRKHNKAQTVCKIFKVHCIKNVCGILYMKQASSTWMNDYNPQCSNVISSMAMIPVLVKKFPTREKIWGPSQYKDAILPV